MKKLYSILFLVLPLFIYGQTTDLIISKYGEGSSNHKFLEIYNGTGADIDLSTYAFPNSNNAPDTVGEYDYWNSFTAGAVIAAGDVYVITDEDADASLLAVQDQEHNYLSNGDDGFKLVKDFTWNDADNDGNVDQGEMTGFTVVDVIGDWQGDPGSGWEVAGVANATKDHTLTRKTSVCSGNSDWASSAGTNADDSEWVVTGQNEGWDTVGSYTTACVQSTSTTVTIGTGTDTNEELPIEPYYGYSYSQVIYTAAEIGVSGTINSVTYSANSATTLSNSGEWDVYMGTTSASSFSSNADWLQGSDLTQVFSGTVTPDGSGNVLVTLDTGFDYVAGDNLVIAVDENASGYDASSHDFYTTATSETRGLTYYSDGTNPDPTSWTSGGYTRDYIANVVLDITESADVSADWSVSVSGADATVSITVNNFTIGATGDGYDGHWHYTLDGGSTVMLYDTNDVVLTGLANGEHTLVAWLVDDNHTALDPAVEETITFTTFNGNYEGSYPYCSSFDADLDNWTAESVSGDANWSSSSANQNSTVTPLTGAGMAYLYDNSSEANLISPSMDLSGVSNPQVTFNHTQVEWAGDQDELRVWYKADANDSWTELAAYTSEVASWTEVTLDLPNPSSTYSIAFNGVAGYGRGITVDDVCVHSGPGDPNTVVADPTLSWLGYMNVFENAGGAIGGYLWGSAWGVADIVTVLNTETDEMSITLKPNYNTYADNPGDSYWQDGDYGNKWMQGITYVESATEWNGADLTFTGYVHHHSLAAGWTANFFIKALDPNNGYADALNGAYETALPTDGQFTVTVPHSELSTGFIVQAGFSVNGLNANPDNEVANGKVVVSGSEDAPMSIGEVDVLEMRIYPNPVDGNFVTILSPVNGTKYIEVFDINGRRVMDTAINNNTLDVSSINSGFYMIKVTVEGQSKISKLVIR